MNKTQLELHAKDREQKVKMRRVAAGLLFAGARGQTHTHTQARSHGREYHGERLYFIIIIILSIKYIGQWPDIVRRKSPILPE